jgi:hypothetical protein
MKVKAIKPIPPSDSYKGLEPEDWRNLNAGLEVDLKEIPPQAKEYFKKEKKKDKK